MCAGKVAMKAQEDLANANVVRVQVLAALLEIH